MLSSTFIDEAQHLDAESLETIRMLSNFETPRQKLIQFVLAGQPALARLLHSPECEQILQRVNIVARLEPLGAQEVERYIDHRLATAGAPRNPFSPDAVRAIAAASKGVPRNINTLCFNALTLAFAEDQESVSAASAASAVSDLALADPMPDQSLMTIERNSAYSSVFSRGRAPAGPFVFAAAILLIALMYMSTGLIAK